MSKIKKIICILLSVIMLLSFNVPVFANDNTQNAINSLSTTEITENLQITVSTDKYSYNASSVATIYVSVKNVSDETLKNVKAQAVFDDLQPVSARKSTTSLEIAELKAGESFDFSYKATLNINKHDLNIFQKIFLWIVRLFNGGYTATNNSIDVINENTTDIIFGKFTAKNVVQVGYDTIDIEEDDDNNSDNSDDSNITEIPTYEELIEDVDIDEIYEYDENDISIDNESGLTYLNNIIILMFEEECSEQERAEIINSINGKVVGGDTLYDELYIEIEKSTLAELETLCDELNNKYNVLAVYETAMTVDSQSLSNLPNDPWIGSDFVNWNVSNGYSISDSNWWILSTETQRAWNYNEYFNNINIGIVDIGFDITHEDLNISVMSKENSYENHGTHVAGIIGATANNEKGISGIVHNKNLYGYSIGASAFDQIKENIFKTDIFKGLKVLVQNNCKVINFSLGFSGKLKNSDRVFIDKTINIWGEQASREIAKLLENGYDFIVTQSAGNGASDGKGVNALQNGLFCSITKDNCYSNKKVSVEQIMNRIIVVANANKLDNNNYQLSTDSNGGSKVDIAAPGTWIYSTLAGIEDTNNLINAGQKYGQLSGTSMASPIVAGVASLVWSVNPNFNGAQVKEIVCSTAEDGGILVKDNPNSPTTGSFYLVNAKLAVEEAIKKTYWTCTVKGSVVDQNSEVLANVNIVATDIDTNKKIVAKNNSDGTFTLLLPCGTYSISLSKYDTEVVVELDKTTYNQEIDLGEILMIIPETTVSGTVKDKDSQLPVSNVIIDVYNAESYEYGDGTETDENGYFEMEIPRDDSYTFTFYHDDYAEPYSMEVNAKITPLDLRDIFLSKDGYKVDNRVITETGNCGDNVTWTLYEDGELVISGNGAISSYTSDVGAPWYSYNDKVLSITIESGITKIGNYAFYDFENLRTVDIAEGIKTIGTKAFNSCSTLSEIKLPNSLTTIGTDAFEYCTNLSTIVIPDNVTKIYDGAFAFCSNLADVFIGNKVQSIGSSAFWECKSLKSIIIPDSVTYVDSFTFTYCTNLETVTIGNGLSNISYRMFDYCENLKNITIGNNVKIIEGDAFARCISLSTLDIPDGVEKIGSSAFFYCTNLSDISVPDSVISIGEGAFKSTAIYNDSSSWENGVLYLGKHLVKANSSINDSYEIKEGTLTILDCAFLGCENLTNISIPNSVTTIGSYAFSSCTKLSNIIIPNSVTVIESGTFVGCTNLTNVTIPYSVTSVDSSAFADCTSLTEITIPNSVTHIGSFAFQNCTSLIEVLIPDNITRISDCTFYNCTSLASVTIPENITSIDDSAFKYCKNLKEVTISNKVTNIGDYAFDVCPSITYIYYIGTQEEWETITIGDYNECLTNATIHYNS